MDRWLRGTPPPEWTKRPRAEDRIRERAVRLRRKGLSYKQIRGILGVGMATLSGWLQDVPLDDLQRARLRQRSLDAARRTARANHERRLAREAEIRRTTAADIGQVSERELFIAGVVAYAAEGTKRKPWQTSMRVIFTNSDPRMILLFLRWLSLQGVSRSSLSFRVSIHRDADIDAAERFWAGIVGVSSDLLKRATLQKGNQKTPRRNIGQGYHGCLVISVNRSSDLNKRLAGWFDALVGD